MKALLKYEFRKTWFAKLIFLGITAVAEIVFLIGIALGPAHETGERLVSIGALVLFMVAMFGVFIIGVQSVLTLHRDMNTKQGYMLYMTPRTSYQILGAKTLENGLSILLSGAFFFLLGFLDITLLFSRFGTLQQLWDFFQDMLHAINKEITLNTQTILCLTVSFLASWLATVSMAYLADILSSALLNGKRFNGIITFLIFILLSVLLGWLQDVLQPARVAIDAGLLIRGGVSLAFSVLLYCASAWIMDRYLSV